MINYDMIRLLAMFSVAVWALMSKTPVKSGVKRIATYIFNNTFPLREKFFSHVPFDDFEQYTIKFFATLLALFMIALAQTIDMVALVDNLGDEWQWIADAELISAAGVISLTVTKYEIAYCANMVFTSVLIGVVGSAGIHRMEKWIAGNGLLFDVLRAWLIKNEQASDIDIAADKLYASSKDRMQRMKRQGISVRYMDQAGNDVTDLANLHHYMEDAPENAPAIDDGPKPIFPELHTHE